MGKRLATPLSTERRAFGIGEWAAARGISRRLAYSLIAEGKLHAAKIGKRTVIYQEDAEAFDVSARSACS